MTTFNNIVKALNEFATNHYQIHTFYSGQTWNFQPNDNIHPSMIVIPQPGSINQGNVELTFSILILDLLNNDHSNLNELLSDTLQIFTDLVAYLNTAEVFEFMTINEVSIEPFEGVQDDDLAGWAGNITFQIPFGGSPCGLPMSDSNY